MGKDKLTKKDLIRALEDILRDSKSLTTGNIAHNKIHIVGNIEWLLQKLK